MTHSVLRSLIRETLLLEEVYGAQAVVYHGTETNPKELIEALVDDTFEPGRGSGSLYGQGLYTVYDLKGSQTEAGYYGRSIIKLKLNLYGYIIFDPEVALKVYKSPLSIVEQAQELGLDKTLVEMLRGVNVGRSEFTSDAARFASKFLKGRVKGLIYTGSNDGRCALVYDPTTAVPIAWKKVRSKKWTPVNRESIKPALRRSAGGGWQEEKYEMDSLRMLKKLESLPLEERIVQDDLDLEGSSITSLPVGLKVRGRLNLMSSKIATLPEGLEVDEDLVLKKTKIESLPADMKVGGDLFLGKTRIASLPKDLQVGGSIELEETPITSIPSGLQVRSSLYIKNTSITSLPNNFKIGDNLNIMHTLITSLPSNLQIGGDLYLSGTSITYLPEDLQVEYGIYGFSGDRSKVPQHLKAKLR
jgi:hypothetical protein